jgi:hypothetical protein
MDDMETMYWTYVNRDPSVEITRRNDIARPLMAQAAALPPPKPVILFS